MSPLVVDSSVVMKWFIPEPYSSQARLILDDYQTGKYAFLAPDHLYAELGNIVWKKHTQRDLPAADAERVIVAFHKLTFELTSTADLLDDAYRLAVTHQRTVYDMLYVALSVRERCSFVTADEKLANALKASMRNVVWLGAWVQSPD